MKNVALPSDLQRWVEARERHRLSHAHVQMARELGLNPKKLGKIDNHRQEPWKLPLPGFIEYLYERRFSRSRPVRVLSIEEHAREQKRRQAERRTRKLQRRALRQADPAVDTQDGTPRIEAVDPTSADP